MRLAIVLFALCSVPLLACATPSEDEEAEEGTGAIEVGAAVRSGLKKGFYQSNDALLVVQGDGLSGLVAYAHKEVPGTTDGWNVTGAVDVSVTGKVTIRDGVCPTVLEVTKNTVKLVPEASRTEDDVSPCFAASATFTYHPMAALAGRYDCAHFLDGRRSSIVLGSVTTKDALVTTLPTYGKKHTFKAKFEQARLLPEGAYTELGWFNFVLAEKVLWVNRGGESATCTLVR